MTESAETSTTIPPRFDPLTGKPVSVFFYYAVPSVLGLLAATSAGVIDGIFIGNYVGATALAAVNISLPAFYALEAFAFLLAVGGSVMCGKYIGEKNAQGASSIFSKTVFASTGLSVSIVLLCQLFLDQLVSALGANEELSAMVATYLTIIMWAMPLLILGITLDYFVRVDGRPILASGAMLAYAVINICLNYIFVVRMGWGLAGAAWATALADACFTAILLTHFFSKRCSLHLMRVPARFKDGWDEVVRAAYNGFSEFANETSVAVITLLFNWVLITRMGVDGVAAFTIIGYLLMVGINTAYGISEALQPTVSKNLGARQPERILQFFKVAMVSVLLVGLFFSALLVLVPGMMIDVFLSEGDVDTRVIALGAIALFWPAFIFNGMNITLAGYLTSLHRPLPSSVIAVCRSLLLPGLGLLLLPRWLGDDGVFLAVPIAEAITFVIGLGLVAWLRPSQLHDS